TGALRLALFAWLEGLVAFLVPSPGRALLALSLSQHPHFVAARHAFWRRRFSALRTIFDKAVSRGDFPRHADPMQFLESLIAPLYLRALVTGGSLEDWPRNEMVDRMLTAYARPARSSQDLRSRT